MRRRKISYDGIKIVVNIRCVTSERAAASSIKTDTLTFVIEFEIENAIYALSKMYKNTI